MGDQAQEPLISNQPEELQDDGRNAADEAALTSELGSFSDGEHKYPGLFVWLLTFSAGIGGLLFGYDTGVISATLVSINSSLSSRALTTLDKSLITASTSLFALLVSPVSGLLADTFGRKRVILLADLLFILGAMIQALSVTVSSMIVGRSVIGLAVGAASFVTPLYIAELSPSKYRGRLVTMSVMFITFGQVVAYLIGWAFAEKGGNDGWRWMVGLGALPAGLQSLVMVLMPESPRWLVKAGRGEAARSVLRKVYGGGEKSQKVSQAVAKAIEVEVREEEEAKRARTRARATKTNSGCISDLGDSWTELFRVPGHLRALTIACLLQGLQQLCGFNSLMYFSATLFSLIGFSTPTLTSLTVAVTNLLFTIVSLFQIDRVGRRRILLFSVPVMSLALLSCAIAFSWIDLPSDTNSHNPSSSSAAHTAVPLSERSSPVYVVASIIVYVAAYAMGLGNVPWQQSELFPLSVRSLGSSLATSTNWTSNFIVGMTFLPMLEWLSPSWTFAFYAAVCGGGWFAIWCVYPETNGLSLEETGELLKNGWGVTQRSAGSG